MGIAIQQNNYAFIDGVNLHLTYAYLGWRLDYSKLRVYLRNRHNVSVAYYFIGFIKQNHGIYEALKAYDYELKFREVSEFQADPITCPNCQSVVKPSESKTKCDCDADIVLQIMNDINDYDRAILISSDGDFDNLVKQLVRGNKLKLVLAPCKAGCSKLLKRASQGRIEFLDNLRGQLEKI